MELHLMHFSESDTVTADTDGVAVNKSEAVDEVKESENVLSPDEEFEELIKGKFADAFNKRTKGIIDKRLPFLRELSA